MKRSRGRGERDGEEQREMKRSRVRGERDGEEQRDASKREEQRDTRKI
jgi:hypothetical protein